MARIMTRVGMGRENWGSRALRAWQRGTTGHPMVDAGMREGGGVYRYADGESYEGEWVRDAAETWRGFVQF